MAASPKGSKHFWPFTAGRDSLTVALTLLAGFACCALIVLQLHIHAPGAGQPSPRPPAAAAARAEAAIVVEAPRVERRAAVEPVVLPAEVADEVPANAAVGAGQPFALIPRPLHLEVLGGLGPSALAAEGPTLWRLADARRYPETPLRAALGEFERLLNVSARELEPASLQRLPEGGVAVALLGDMAEASSACARLVGRGSIAPRALGLASPLLTEWHVAVRWEGRLAVCAVEPEGAFRFAATLRQMLDHRLRPSAAGGGKLELLRSLPSFLLEDWPRYQWRGLQLDCVRHFMPLDFIKRYLTAMAYYKANAFHWHLTDDQAWRLYIPSRPALAGSNKWSPEYYSTEDVREIVDFAARLFITVLPTIETPGHCLAALAAYPELACEGDKFEVPKTRVGTYEDIMCVGKKVLADFARDVFEDVVRLFPGPLVHVGGDEVLPGKWQRSPHTKAFAGKVGLANLGPDLMESWYCFLSELLKGLNRTIVMWDDHFRDREWQVSRRCPGAEKDWVVQAWKMDPPVGNQDIGRVLPSWQLRTIASPMKSVYLDYPVASIDYNKTLDWYLGGNEDVMMGGCANMWTEDSEPKDVGAKVYPRYLGIAERLWNGGARGRPSPARPRLLDAASRAAALRHCGKGGPLLQDFGFACGKFEQTVNGRAKVWQGARVTNTIDLYADAFSPERAVDDDEESYFWGIAPKQGDFFEVSFAGPGQHAPRGKWLRRVVASTGAKDRPGDRLEKGHLQVAQWLPTGESGHEKYRIKFRTLAEFKDGVAAADEKKLLEGPVVTVKIVCTEYQTKWMALTEISAEEGQPQEHPTAQEYQEAVEEDHRRRHHHSGFHHHHYHRSDA